MIVATFEALRHADARGLVARRRARYVEAIERHGGRVVPLDEDTDGDDRRVAFETMDGLLLAGGADVAPALYGEEPNGTGTVHPGRDALELEAWDVAEARRLPVLGICRGIQVINVFMGGGLLQHVDGHDAPGYGSGAPPQMHELRPEPGTRVGGLLGQRPLHVNSYHHQAIDAARLAPGLVASAWSAGPGLALVEALESADPGWFVAGVQCHPERTEFTPPEFERLFATFLEACRATVPTTR